MGGGLAGLTCARRLQVDGRKCVVLEAADAVGGRVRTDIVATDAFAGAQLLPKVPSSAWNHVTCLYFAAPPSPIGAPTLAINGSGTGVVNHVAVLSDVSPRYAPADQALVSVSVLGDQHTDDRTLAQQLQTELGTWFGAPVQQWRWLRSYRIPHALPVRMPLERRAPAPVRPGVWVTGDFTNSASIQGAMEERRTRGRRHPQVSTPAV